MIVHTNDFWTQGTSSLLDWDRQQCNLVSTTRDQNIG